MSTINLGRLEKVDMREVWSGETNGFTPGLAQEGILQMLGEMLDLELELEAEEDFSGASHSGILCREASTGQSVWVESQFERTDGVHLGQLLERAAALKAGIIVWIAGQLGDEQRAALEWLNEIAAGRARFFGLELELWRIGDSALAPKFNLVVRPNGRGTGASQESEDFELGELSGMQQIQLDFWREFRDCLNDRKSPIGPARPQPQNWIDFPIGREYFNLVAFISAPETRAGVTLVVHGPQGNAHFRLLKQDRVEIETQAGCPLEWLENPGSKESHIRLQLPDANLAERENWPQVHAWLAENLEIFNRVFRMRVRQLKAEGEGPVEG
jgi:hypothetical protein